MIAFLSLIVLLLGGWGCAALIFPGCKSWGELMAHSWLLGALLVSGSQAMLGMLCMGPWPAALLVIAPFIAALRKARPRERREIAWPRGFLEWGLLLAILCQCFVLLRYASTTALAWDGLVIWEAKARIAFASGGHLPLEYFTDPQRAWSHPDYPLMLPLLETWVYLWNRAADQSLVRIILPFFYVAALLLLYSGVTEISGKRWAGLLTAALLFFVPFLTVGQFNLFTGYADFPLAVLYLAAVISFIRYRADRSKSQFILFAIYSGALPWMKHEGSVLWLCLICVASVEFLRERKPRLALAAAAPGVVVIAGWKLFLAAAKAIPSSDFMPVTVKNITENAGRIGTILGTLGHDLSSTSDWSILWIVFPIALLIISLAGKPRLAVYLAVIVLVPLALYSSVYILSNWGSYEAHIDSSLPRLISQVSLVALLTLGIALPASRSEG